MIKIALFGEEWDRLKYTRKKTDASASEKCLYVLLSDEGKSVPEIAKHTKCNGHTIRPWLTSYHKDGLEDLKGIRLPRRPFYGVT